MNRRTGRKQIGAKLAFIFKEQYESLKHSLLSSYPAEKIKIIAFTGATLGDGISNTAVNLAAAMSNEQWRSVLLIDADLRHPSLHEVFNLPKGKGLSDYLADEADAKPNFSKVKDNFYLLAVFRQLMEKKSAKMQKGK